MGRFQAVFSKDGWQVIDTQKACKVIAPANNRKAAVDYAAELNTDSVLQLVTN
jgi:hypothetical protein